jgi:acetyl esterase/lipase
MGQWQRNRSSQLAAFTARFSTARTQVVQSTLPRAFLWVGLTLGASLFGGRTADAAAPEEMLLWPNGAPGALGTEEKDRPKLIYYAAPDSASHGTAVVILPGGGYGHVAIGHEGHDIAAWLNGLGCAAFIVDYRHRNKGYGHPAPLQDAQRAIRTVRYHAERWRVKPDRIGVIGFSAGGHLASCTGVFFDNGQADAQDPVERVSSRPDFLILSYPVIAFGESYVHAGSQRNLLGPDATAEQIQALATHKHVRQDSPPTFLWHTTEDAAVPAENSIAFYLALKQHGVPCELHIFQSGRHGLGLARGAGPAELWPELCRQWMVKLGFLP